MLSLVIFSSLVSGVQSQIVDLGSSTGATINAIGAYHWSCVNFTSPYYVDLENITTYVAATGGLNVNTHVGIFGNNASRGPAPTTQYGSNSSDYNSFSVGFMNWSFLTGKPALTAGTQYWACWYVNSGNFIRIGETLGSGQGIWASSTGDNLATMTIDSAGGTNTVKTLNIKLWGTLATLANVTITLTSPTNGSTISSTSVNLTSNYSVVSYNMTNVTYSLWYGNGTIRNMSTLSVTGNSTNGTTITFNNLSLGSYTWNANLCVINLSGSTNCSQMSFTNSTFNIGATGVFGYTNHTYETARETFSANISITSGTSISSAVLYYNNTPYNGTSVNLVSSNLYQVSKDIDVPLNANPFANQSNNLFWSITYLGGFNENLTTQTQNVSFITLQLCNATYTTPTLNFTLKNESDFVETTGSIEAFFRYYLGQNEVAKNLTYNTSTIDGPSKYNFCLYPYAAFAAENKSLKTNMDLSYLSSSSVRRYYLLENATLTNTTSLTDLLLIPTSTGVQFTFDVRRGTDLVTNALVYISRQYISLGNNYKTIGIRRSDDNGKFVEYLDLNIAHQATIIKDGQLLGIVSFNSICSSAPCEITLPIPTDTGNILSSYDDTFGGNVLGNMSYNETSHVITYSYVDLTGLAKYVRLEVKQSYLNSTENIICNNFLYSVAGSVSCDITGYTGDISATAYISRSPEKILEYIKIFIEGVDALGDTGLLVALLLGGIIVSALMWYDIGVGIISLPCVLAVLKLAHILPLSWIPIVGLLIGALYLNNKVSQ